MTYVKMSNFEQHDSIQKTIQKTIQKKSLRLTELQQKVVIEMAMNPSIDRANIARTLGVGEGDVINSISALKKKGLIIREGGRKYGKWRIILDDSE